MDRFTELLMRDDFLTNLFAGAIFFVAELLLIALFLPWLIERTRDHRWLPARRALVRNLNEATQDFSFLHHSLSTRLPLHPFQERRSQIADMRTRLTDRYRLLLTELQIYSPSLNAHITPLLAAYVSNLAQLNSHINFLDSLGLPFPQEHIQLHYQALLDALKALNAHVGVYSSMGQGSPFPAAMINASPQGPTLIFRQGKATWHIARPDHPASIPNSLPAAREALEQAHQQWALEPNHHQPSNLTPQVPQ